MKPADPRDRQPGLHAAFGFPFSVSYGLGEVPAHCPYRPGDWVVVHGYPGCVYQVWRDGFRGFVLGCMGSTLLRGLTDDGREWCEHWGRLDPDGTPGDSALPCSCCPHPSKLPRGVGPGQGALFELGALALLDGIS